MLTRGGGPLLSPALERALRLAAVCHRDQLRRGSGVPYVAHPMAVALILDRLGFPEAVVIAGLLHDAVEDTDVTPDQIREAFGPVVAEAVGHCTEVKRDAQGRERPWDDRKRDHLEALERAPAAARAVALADKLHNLRSIEQDLREGRPVWSAFHAGRDQVIGSYREALRRLVGGDPRLEILADECRGLLDAIEVLGGPGPGGAIAPTPVPRTGPEDPTADGPS